MNSDTPLDFALFHLSPRRSRCELFVSGDGKTEKLASGLLKPFVTHLKAAEQQAAQPTVQSIRLEVEKRKHAGTWFSKGTLERFVRFVSTPEVLEVVSTLDAEMSQLEGARRIYSQGMGDQHSGASGEGDIPEAASADVTKKELLRAIDVRLVAVRQDLAMACARASTAGFTLESVSELRLFADHFGAHRLNEACSKFVSLCQRRPELIPRPQEHHPQASPSPPAAWKGPPLGLDDRNVRGSSGSDMSVDEPEEAAQGVAAAASATRPVSGPWPSSNTGSSSSSSGSSGSSGSGNPGQLGQSQQQQAQRPFRVSSAEPPAHELEAKAPALTKSSSSQKIVDEEEKSSSLAQPAAGGSRRMSVQDRINLFENKRKEQSGGAAVGIGGKAGGKAELRRLSSDVSSSVEKSVLRRWSGASDMSIDLPGGSSGSNNRREVESAATTPSSFATPKALVSSENEERDTASSQPRPVVNDPQATTSFSSSQFSSLAKGRDYAEDGRLKDQVSSSEQHLSSLSKEKAGSLARSGSSSRFTDGPELGGQSSGQNSLRSSSSVADKELRHRSDSDTPQKSFVGITEQQGSIVKLAPWAQVRAVSGATEQETSKKEQPSSVSSNRVAHVRLRESGTAESTQVSSERPMLGQPEDVHVDQPISLNQFKLSASKTEDMGLHKKSTVGSQVQQKSLTDRAETSVPKGEALPPQSQSHGKPFIGKPEEPRKSESVAQAQGRVFPSMLKEEEYSDVRGIKLHRQASAPGQKRFHDKVYERTSTQESHLQLQGNAVSNFPAKKAGESANAFVPVPSSATEPLQMVRSSKGNQELNDELQMKADELEKLFAAHKLRIHGDQASASRRGRPVDLARDVTERGPADVLSEHLSETRLARDPPSNGTEFDPDMLVKIDSRDYANMSRQRLGHLSPLEDPRGKFYEKYLQKRDAKLREEWDSKRAQKEANMKKMHEDLERSRAEMAKFAGSADKQDSAFHARRRAEKLRSFSLSLAMKSKEPLESSQSEDDEDQESSEHTLYGHESSFGEIMADDSSSISNNSRKLLSNRSMSSSTPRTSAVSVPRSLKGVNSASGRRRMQSDNLLAQSVPNFSDLRKENTKPPGSIKITSRSHLKNSARNKSSNDDIVKEEKQRKSQSVRKGSPNPGELKELSPVNSDSVILMPLKSSKDQSDVVFITKVHKSGESKPFLRKGSGIGPGAGAGIVKSKTSAASENLKNEEESELVDELRDSPYLVREEDEEEFERISAEEADMAVDSSAVSDNEKQSLSQGSGIFGEPCLENGEISRSFSQVDDDSVGALAAISTKFNTSAGVVQGSPESPGSWNSNMNHSFSYAHETSDIDVSVDSPVGSPASWNSHSLNQMEADVARMRKKWGNAQKPIMIANSSNQPRKDVTKGFKRLLKFGRKNKGAESLVTDWVSASTASEGDDDTEDGRDPANRSSDDLRKTRMGFSQNHYTHDGFNDNDSYHEQVQSLRTSIPAAPADFKLREDHVMGSSLKAPRSFFSLSSFRSKGSESKLR